MADTNERSTWDATALERAKVNNPSEATKKSPEWQETQKEAKISLEKLKKDIEAGKISVDLAKTYLENIEDLKDSEFKPMVLGMILSGLNRKWIKFWEIKDGKLFLEKWNDAIVWGDKYATYEETRQYEEVINDAISAGKISIQDITKTYLFRTSEIASASKEKLSTSQYAVKLLKKYNIGLNLPKWNTLEWYSFESKNVYDNIIANINYHIKDNHADKEFLVLYFNNIYNKNNTLGEEQVAKFESFEKKANKSFIDELGKLDDKTKAVLGLNTQDDEKDIINKWKHTPKAALMDAFKNDAAGWWVLFWIIGWLLWGKKWFFWGLLWGIAFAGWGDKIIANLYNKAKDSFWSNNRDDEEKPESSWEKPNEGATKTSLFKKYESVVWNDTGKLEKEKVTSTWEALSKNDKFLGAPATILKTFETQKDGLKQAEELKKYGIELTSENKEYYAFIFEKIAKHRAENIGTEKEKETIKEYLERTSQAQAVAWTPATAEAKTEKPASAAVQELETLKREWYSDLYILSRWIELWYTFSKEPPKWIPPEKWEKLWSKILGWAWYVVTTPISVQAYKYLAGWTWYFIFWGLHKSLESGNIWKIPNAITWGINWVWNGAMNLLSSEISAEKNQLRKYIQSLDVKVSANALEADKIKVRLEALEKLEVAFKSWDQGVIKTALDDYKATFNSKFRPWVNKAKEKTATAEIKRIKDLEVEAEKHQTELKQKLAELDEKAKKAKTPQEVEVIKQEAQDVAKKANLEIEKLNKNVVVSLWKLDEEAMKKVVSESKFTANLVKANNWMTSEWKFTNKWVDKKMWWISGTAFIWVWLASLIYNGRWWISEMWKNWVSEENANDLKDLWIGMIPVIGWLHDLKIAIEWKDLNNRELSTWERAMRTGFGIIGLIPGAWLVTKWLFKGTKAVVAGSEVAIQAAHLSGKALTYWALWYSMVTASYDIIAN